MNLSDREKQALILYRLKQAKETAEDAAFLMDNGRYTAAVNRIYYAVFYCLLALALKEGYKTSKHLQLIGWFNKEFIATGEIGNEYGKILRNCYEYRKSADYDAFVDFKENDIAKLFEEMRKFTEIIEKFILKS